jgi:hypothetical protein
MNQIRNLGSVRRGIRQCLGPVSGERRSQLEKVWLGTVKYFRVAEGFYFGGPKDEDSLNALLALAADWVI